MVSNIAVMFAFVIIFVAIVAFIIASNGKARAQRRFNMSAPMLNSSARVVDERTAITGRSGQYGGTTTTQYFATFELPDGQRLEFAVDGEMAGQLVVGDTGSLYWQGTWFRGFQREILR